MNKKPIVLIMCGGQSLRLWPLSEYKSKNFMDIFGFSPLELTIKRFLRITLKNNIFFVTNQREKKDLLKSKLVKKENIIAEPASKNTAPAIFLSVLYLLKKFHPETPIIISPVDHLIKGGNFYSSIKLALKSIKKEGICALGIKPIEPTPHFGYIQAGKRVAKGVTTIKRFIEKPSVTRAKKLIRSKGVSYNSGMFISTLGFLSNEYKKLYPSYKSFVDLFKKKKLALLYKRIKDVPFDKAIMEKTKKSFVVKGDFFWRDFGNWNALYEVLPKDLFKNVKNGKVVAYNSSNNLGYVDEKDKQMLLVGVNNIAIINTPKYILIASRDSLNGLKSIVKQFKKRR